MSSLLIFVLSFTFVCAILIEVHCRLQLKLIIKPRTKLNLVIHYSIFIPYVCCIIIYLLKVQDITQSLGLTELKTSLLFFGSGIFFTIPVIYIMSWRYPGLLEKMENWRKNT
jgi:hypothetical protein